METILETEDLNLQTRSGPNLIENYETWGPPNSESYRPPSSLGLGSPPGTGAGLPTVLPPAAPTSTAAALLGGRGAQPGLSLPINSKRGHPRVQASLRFIGSGPPPPSAALRKPRGGTASGASGAGTHRPPRSGGRGRGGERGGEAGLHSPFRKQGGGVVDRANPPVRL